MVRTAQGLAAGANAATSVDVRAAVERLKRATDLPIAVGFGVLVNFIATFTYISFHLAAPPYALSATALGAVFALLIAQLSAFGILIFPKITLVLVFLLMALVLVIRPWGLMGKPDAGHGRVVLPEGILGLERFGQTEKVMTGAAALLLLALPWIGDAYLTKVAIEVLTFALAAFSLNFLIGNGGLVSFGHAAYFGLGAYGAGLLATRLGVPMEPALLAAPVVAGLGAALFGFFIVRLAGIYLAMLTLAFAQITYAVAFQWVEVTGGDNGVVGVWPSRWAASREVYYYLVLLVTGAAVLLLRQTIYAPFGYTLRAARDSSVRADAIGVDVRTHRWLAFTLAGAAAGLAGGLFAFSKGSIDPTLISIPMSVDFLVMVLVGGILGSWPTVWSTDGTTPACRRFAGCGGAVIRPRRSAPSAATPASLAPTAAIPSSCSSRSSVASSTKHHCDGWLSCDR